MGGEKAEPRESASARQNHFLDVGRQPEPQPLQKQVLKRLPVLTQPLPDLCFRETLPASRSGGVLAQTLAALCSHQHLTAAGSLGIPKASDLSIHRLAVLIPRVTGKGATPKRNEPGACASRHRPPRANAWSQHLQNSALASLHAGLQKGATQAHADLGNPSHRRVCAAEAALRGELRCPS